MKKPIIILSAGIVVVSLIWLVYQTFLAKESAPKTADKQQKTAVAQQGSSPTEQKTTTKQKFKPPVYDFPKKSTATPRRQLSSFTKRQRSPNGLNFSNHRRSNSRSSLNTKPQVKD